jgi:hypothetical protein
MERRRAARRNFASETLTTIRWSHVANLELKSGNVNGEGIMRARVKELLAEN